MGQLRGADAGTRQSPVRRKEVFYLTTHSTHLVTVIWRRIAGKKTAGSQPQLLEERTPIIVPIPTQ